MDKIQWHPAFYGGIEWELRDYSDKLIYEREYELSKKPLKMDLLVIRKSDDFVIDKSIASIFRKYNIVEYKSPDDGLTIDDFYKVIGYALFYKGMADHVDEIKTKELTVSFFQSRFPAKLMKNLKSEGAAISEKFEGIYYINGIIDIPIQIVVLDKLEKSQYKVIRAIKTQIDKEDFLCFIDEASEFRNQGEYNNYEAVLKVVLDANPDIFESIKEDEEMGDSLYDKLKERDKKHEQIGEERGKVESIRNAMKNFKVTAEQAMEGLGIPKSEYKKYLTML